MINDLLPHVHPVIVVASLVGAVIGVVIFVVADFRKPKARDPSMIHLPQDDAQDLLRRMHQSKKGR